MLGSVLRFPADGEVRRREGHRPFAEPPPPANTPASPAGKPAEALKSSENPSTRGADLKTVVRRCYGET
jgi:hypothetical protein